MLTTIRTGGTVELNWLPPLHPNGDIHYDIEYEPARIPGDPATATGIRTCFYTLSLLVGALSYNVRVVAVNTQGRTSSNVLVVCTGPKRGTIAKVDVHFFTSFVFNCCFSKPVPLTPICCCFLGPDPPTDVSAVATADTAVVSWTSSFSGTCDQLATQYRIRYKLSTGSGVYHTVTTEGNIVVLLDLIPNAEYNVSVAAINSNGAMSNFSIMAQFKATPAAEASPG